MGLHTCLNLVMSKSIAVVVPGAWWLSRARSPRGREQPREREGPGKEADLEERGLQDLDVQLLIPACGRVFRGVRNSID